jgi:hypothetical protein
MARRFQLATLYFLGELGRLSRLMPGLLGEAEANGDAYTTMFLRGMYGPITWLVRDDVEGCQRQIELARRDWAESAYPIPRSQVAAAESHLHLYLGDPDRAAAVLEECWPSLESAHMLYVGILRVQFWHLRAAVTLARASRAAARGERARARDLRAEGRRALRKFSTSGIPRAAPMAAVLEASIHVAEGDKHAARGRLRDAVAAFDRLGMRMFAATALVRLAELVDDEEAAGITSQAEQIFCAEGIEKPARMVEVLAAGAW